MSDVKLYHGDCLEILPTLESGSVDAVVTDPPYLNLKGGVQHGRDGGVGKVINPSVSIGDEWGATMAWAGEAWRVARYGLLIFCGFNSVCDVRMAFPEATAKGLLVWQYSNPSPSYRNVPRYDVEFVWLLAKSVNGIDWHRLTSCLIQVPKLPAGCFASERVLKEGSKQAAHPAQKPLKLMDALLVDGINSVLDPFAGTGTTGVACIKTGRNFIGIEIDPDYYAIAEKRIAEAQQQPMLEGL